MLKIINTLLIQQLKKISKYSGKDSYFTAISILSMAHHSWAFITAYIQLAKSIMYQDAKGVQLTVGLDMGAVETRLYIYVYIYYKYILFTQQCAIVFLS